MPLGIDALKKTVEALVNIGINVDRVTQDGLQPLQDGLALIPNLVDVVSIVKNGKAAWDEFQDLDDDEKDDLMADLSEKLNLADDKLEAVVESAFELLLSAGILLDDIREALKEE